MLFYCSQSDAVELQKELQNEYGYSIAQLTEAAGLGAATAIVKVQYVLQCGSLFLMCKLCVVTYYKTHKR